MIDWNVSELNGIPVHELRTALQIVCESEAYSELQHRVASLSVQLEAATVINNTNNVNNNMSTNAFHSNTSNNAATAAAHDKSMTSKIKN